MNFYHLIFLIVLKVIFEASSMFLSFISGRFVKSSKCSIEVVGN